MCRRGHWDIRLLPNRPVSCEAPTTNDRLVRDCCGEGQTEGEKTGRGIETESERKRGIERQRVREREG